MSLVLWLWAGFGFQWTRLVLDSSLYSSFYLTRSLFTLFVSYICHDCDGVGGCDVVDDDGGGGGGDDSLLNQAKQNPLQKSRSHQHWQLLSN